MDPSQNPLPNDQRPNEDVVALLPRQGPTGEEARSGDPDGQRTSGTKKSRSDIDVEGEQVRCASAVQMSELDSAPFTQASPAPSAKSFELMSGLEALARDFAAAGARDSSDQRIRKAQEETNFSVGLEKVEPSIRVSPRPEPCASDKPSVGGRTVLTLTSFFMVALIGIGATLAWQSNRAAEPTGSAPAARVSSPDAALQRTAVAQTAMASTASATSSPPGLVQQLQAMALDLTAVRNDVKHLAAEQEHLAAMQQQLEQLAAAQQQFAAKQEQMAQNLAKLQAIEQNIRHKRSPVSLPRAVPMPPRRNAPTNAPPKAGAQASSAPHPRPPMPVP